MRTPTLFVVMGYSGSGKDTVGNIIKTATSARIVKFAAPGKRALEFMLKVPEGLMDDREARIQVAPNCQGRTYLQVLMDFYHHRKLVIGEDLFTAQTMEELDDLSDDGIDAIVTDVRNANEGEAIIELVNKYRFEVILIWVSRDGAKMLSTDTLQHNIRMSLIDYAAESYVVYNNGTKDDLANYLHLRGII